MKYRLAVAGLLLLALTFATAQVRKTFVAREDLNVVNPILAVNTTCTDAALTTALSAIGASQKVLLLSPIDGAGAACTWTIANNITLPRNVVLRVPKGALLSVNSGRIFTLNGPHETDDPDWYSGAGTVVFNSKPWDSTERFATMLAPYAISGCRHTTSASTVSPSLSCEAVTKDGRHITQTATTVTYSAGNGTYCLAAHKDTTTTIAGWTRQGSTNLLWQANACPATIPESMLLLQEVTVAGGAITAVVDHADRVMTGIVSEGTSFSTAPRVHWRFEPGGQLCPANGVTITHNGSMTAGNSQSICTTTTGVVRLQNRAASAINPMWTGAVANGTTDDTAAIQEAIDLVGRTTGAITRGRLVFPCGTYALASTVTIDQQALTLDGADCVIFQWTGNNTTPMFNVRDSTNVTFRNMTLLGALASQPTAGIYFESATSSPVGTNEFLRVEQVRFGRLKIPGGTISKELQRGVWLAGAVNGNNDTYLIRDSQFADCTTAGLAVDNSQSIWGLVENVLFDTNGYGINTGSSFTGINLLFNRSVVADFRCFRDVECNIVGFNSEHSALPIVTAQSANLHIVGGKILLHSELLTQYWTSIPSGQRLVLSNIFVRESPSDPPPSAPTKLLFSGSSTEIARLSIQNSEIPGISDGSGVELDFNGGTMGGYADIEYGDYARHDFLHLSFAYDPVNLVNADGVTASTTGAFADIAPGQLIFTSFNQDLQGVLMTGAVPLADTTTARFQNETGGDINIAAGTLFWRKIAERLLKAKAVVVGYDPPSMADGAGATTTVNTPGAVMGDCAVWTHTANFQAVLSTAYVSSAGVTSVRFQNESGGVSDQPAGDLTVALLREELADYRIAVTYDPGGGADLADGAGETVTITLPGIRLGDYVVASFSEDLAGVLMLPYVSASNLAAVRFQNETGGAVPLASGTLRILGYSNH